MYRPLTVVYSMRAALTPGLEPMFYRLHLGRSELVARFDHSVDGGLSLSPDESQLYYGQIDESTSDLLLVDNFWR